MLTTRNLQDNLKDKWTNRATKLAVNVEFCRLQGGGKEKVSLSLFLGKGLESARNPIKPYILLLLLLLLLKVQMSQVCGTIMIIVETQKMTYHATYWKMLRKRRFVSRRGHHLFPGLSRGHVPEIPIIHLTFSIYELFQGTQIKVMASWDWFKITDFYSSVHLHRCYIPTFGKSQ